MSVTEIYASDAKARLAVVGAGTAGRRHIDAIVKSDAAELAGIVDTDPARHDTGGLPDTIFASTVEQLLQTVRPDGVVIATPTDHHTEPTLQCLAAGCSVLIEKPVSDSLAEARRIRQAESKSGGWILVGHQRRYHSQVAEARRVIQSKTLGRLVMVSGLWGVRKHRSYYDPAWRRSRQAGPVMINLTHELDLLRHLCGEIQEVFAFSGSGVEGWEKEDVVAVSLRFKSGVLGSFILSDRVVSPWAWEFSTGENILCPKLEQNYLNFAGTEASLEFPNLVLWRQDQRECDWTRPIHPAGEATEFVNPFILQVEHFAKVALGRESPRITVSDAVRNLEAALAVLEAARTGRAQRLN
ncbi:MAG: Gfo/Idh/MocA family oxidoreductase [Rhodobacteraceae bacterium]|nr:Gfo/Idh/MocA family oxidoreductase [Paracoccaceae bacterium]